MNHKPNIGIIGAGMMGGSHVENILQTRRANVLWLADTDKQILRQKLAKYDVPSGSADYRDVLKDSKVDAVIIASPPFTHLEMAVAAMNTGKHVLIEKPLTIDRRKMNRLVIEVQKHKNLVILEGSARHSRLQPKFHFVKKLIDDGAIGDVYHIHHNHLMRRTFIEYNPRGTWSLKKSLAGAGPFLDWGEYDLSFHLGLFGDRPKLVKIKSFARNGIKVFRDPKIKSDVEEHGSALIEFDTGLSYYYERGAGCHCEVVNETRILGTKGSLRFQICTWDSPEIEHFWVNKNRVEKRTVYKVDMSKHPGDNPALINHFLDCLAGKSKPAMPVALAAKHFDILFRILGK
jgi:predicted dehydrogenase